MDSKLMHIAGTWAAPLILVMFISGCAFEMSESQGWAHARSLMAREVGDLSDCDRLETAFAYLMRTRGPTEQGKLRNQLNRGPHLSDSELIELAGLLRTQYKISLDRDGSASTLDYRPDRIRVSYDDLYGAKVACS